MRLTTKGRYALIAMTYMKIKHDEGHTAPVRLADISSDENMPLNYLEQLFRKLRLANLVFSVRGPGGGYKLAVEKCDVSKAKFATAKISYKEILDAVGEKVSFHENLDGNAGTSSAGIVVSQLSIIKSNLIKDFNSMII